VVAAPRDGVSRLSLRIDTSLVPAVALGDPALLERLIGNLVDNAVDHNVQGGVVIVATSSDEEAGLAVLTVTNTGPRISASETVRLLVPFQRLSAERVAGSGHHGLGLSIVRAIVAAHDGELTIEPQPEGGLSVTVAFPLSELA
jgi:signal transduction histidine kinase